MIHIKGARRSAEVFREGRKPLSHLKWSVRAWWNRKGLAWTRIHRYPSQFVKRIESPSWGLQRHKNPWPASPPASNRWDPRGSVQMNTQGDSPSCSGIACWTFNRHMLYPGTNYRQVLICRSQTGHGVLNFWQAPNTSELTDCTLGPLSRGQPTSSPKDHVNILGNLGLTAPAVPL